MTIPYSTLDAAMAELKATTSGNNTISQAQKNQLAFYLRVATKRLEKLLGFEFIPRIETRDFLLSGDRLNSTLNTLYIGQPLLALTGVSLVGTTLTVPTQVTTWPVNNQEPVRHLRLVGCTSCSWYNYCPSDCAPPVVSITGIWGYRTRYTNEAWVKYDDLQAGITDSATTLTVADADGLDPFGLTPRFSLGQLIRIGTEYLEVTAVNTSTNVLTVRRGVQGSTAAAHSNGDDVDSWVFEDEVRRVIERQAAMMLARIGAFQVSEVTDIGTIQYPADLLSELHAVATLYAYT